MIRLWKRWRTSTMLDEGPRSSRARPGRTVTSPAPDLLETDDRLRHDVSRARTPPPADLRRRILRGLSDAPRISHAITPLRTRAAARPALIALTTAVLLVALVAPDMLAPPSNPRPGIASLSAPHRSPDRPATAGPAQPSIMERLLAAPQRAPRPRLEVPLIVEAKLMMQDARDATDFMLAHIPARYRPEPRSNETTTPIGD